jgi:hypothetical protein
MTAPELLPCPFCAGGAYLHGFSTNRFVMCIECGAQSDDGGLQRVIAAWNRRTPARAREESEG